MGIATVGTVLITLTLTSGNIKKASSEQVSLSRLYNGLCLVTSWIAKILTPNFVPLRIYLEQVIIMKPAIASVVVLRPKRSPSLL